MRLVLSDAEQDLLADTTRLLLSPLDEPVEPWRVRVLEHLARLLGADMGGFILPAGEAPPYSLHNLPDDFAREYFAMLGPSDSGTGLVRMTQANICSTRLLTQLTGISVEEGWFASREYREFYSRYGVEEGIGYMVTTAPPLAAFNSGSARETSLPGAVLTCFHAHFGSDERDERGLAILRLLQPALEAGVADRVRLGRLRDTLQQLFDAVRDGLQLCDAEGRRLHANAALLRMLEDDPQGEVIRGAIDRVANGLRGLLAVSGIVDLNTMGAAEAASLEVATGRARYQVGGQLVAGAGFGGAEAILITVVQLTPTLPTPRQLQERWRLSPQEARVALLVAQGRSNTGIAAAMGLRPSTVRHYTESVFHKLGVHTRAGVGQRILFE